MADEDLFDRINALSREEEALWAKAGDGSGLDGGDVARLDEIKVQLDQVYDLLHQRQGRRDAGQDPLVRRELAEQPDRLQPVLAANLLHPSPRIVERLIERLDLLPGHLRSMSDSDLPAHRSLRGSSRKR